MNQGGQNTEEVKGLGPELTGRAVAEAAASDFSLFFLPWCPYEVRVSFGPVHAAKVRKDGKGSYIVIPNVMAQDVITTPERLLFHLLMIGHEIAHLVHRHLDDASEQSADDYRSLELWADFYGAKVAMALLTFGRQLRPIAAEFWPDRDLHKVLNNLGDAVGFLVTMVYSNHEKYPKKIERAGQVTIGVLAFVRTNFGKRFDVRLYYSVPNRVFLCPPVRELIADDVGGFEASYEALRRAKAWHRKAQGNATAITPGFYPALLPYLHTTFGQTEEELEAGRKERLDEIKRAGLFEDTEADRIPPTDTGANPHVSDPNLQAGAETAAAEAAAVRR